MLLHRRSIVLEVCLVLIAAHGATSADEYDYSAETDDYNYGADPDYTKYFKEATAAASDPISNKQAARAFESKFVYPAEYESFYFAPSPYADPKTKESTAPKSFVPHPKEKTDDPFEEVRDSFEEKEAAFDSNPLQKDYFEESQKKQQAEESEIKPGPHYVSHQIPVPELYDDDKGDEDESQSKDDVETIPPPLKGRSRSKPKNKSGQPGFGSYQDTYDSFRKTEEQIEQSNPAPYYGGKNADYDTGKSSSTVSQYPAASGYLSNLKVPTTTQLPYDKYSFQPATTNYEALQTKYLENLANTASPLKNTESPSLNTHQERDDGQVAPSENVPENLKKKGCRRIDGPENAENMNCFVCEDAINKAKYTQCSYASSEEPVNQYAGSSVSYTLPVKAPASFRYKRSPSKGKYSEDPYFIISQRHRQYFDDYEKEQQAAESARDRDFHYKPYDDESYSESQSSELLKQPGACHEVEREGSTCTVCKDPKTGGNFEQCSYTSAPKEHKYAYVAEKKYDSDDEPEETRIETRQSSPEDPQKGSSSSQVPQSAVAPTEKFSTATKSKIIKDPIPELSAAGTTIDVREHKPETEESEDADSEDDEQDRKKEKESYYGPYNYNYGGELKKEKKLVSDDPYKVPEHFAASVSHKNTAEDDEEENNFDEYHYKLFPELNRGESRNEELRTDATEQKPQDVEEVLAEFAKKDRSKCKKAEKNGMTCFLCVDQNKVQHEECMYIAESKPRPTHIAYHEVQRLKDPKDEHQPLESDQEEPEESKKVETSTQQFLDVLPLASETSKKKRFFKKVITTPLPLRHLELSGSASEVHGTVVPYERKTKGYRRETIKDSKSDSSAPDSERVEGEAIKEDNNKGAEEPETPKEIDVGDEEGAFSHETKPVYSKLFGTNLPRYMVEKTEFEKDFDAVSGFD